MAGQLTQLDLDKVKALMDLGDYAEAYDYLSDRGYKYADLAKGVLEESTFSGRAAIEFMKNTALQDGRELNGAGIDEIKRAMAKGYLDALQDQLTNSPNKVVTREINSKEAWDLHNEIFDGKGLGHDAWTLNTIFEILGDDLSQKYWDKVLDLADTPSGEIALAVSTMSLMLALDLAQSNLLLDINQKMQLDSWLKRMAFDKDNIEDFFDQSKEIISDFLRDLMHDLGMDKNKNGIPDGLESGLERIRELFNDFMNWLPRRDPLSLDLDGDGLETLAQAGFNGVLFDHDGDGVKTASGWIGRDDGFLARDLNGNGKIDSGAELFGDSTRLRNGQLAKNGFEALADLDDNADGRVDASDEAFASLRVWKDSNSNGVVDAGELRTLADWGITALNTAHTTGSTNLGNGNQLAERGSYVGANNQLGLMGDLNFSESNFHRTFTDHIAPTARTRNLADARGAGMVRDLREAATLSDTVATLVEQYSAVTTRGAQMTRIVL